MHEVKRIFLGDEKPLLLSAAEKLLRDNERGLLERTLILVPTQGAGDLLKRALIEKAATGKVFYGDEESEYGESGSGALFMPEIVTTGGFIRLCIGEDVVMASEGEHVMAWCACLREPDEATDRFLLRRDESEWGRPLSFARALNTAVSLVKMKRSLSEEGLSLKRFVERLRDVAVGWETLPELETQRWMALAGVNERVRALLESWGLRDPMEEELRACEEPRPLREGLKRIILLGHPDPSPVCLSMLDCFAMKGIEVSVWIHAGEGLAETFDAYGRPRAEAWGDGGLKIAVEEKNILRTPSAMDLSDSVVDHLRGLSLQEDEVLEDQITLGMCDAGYAPFIRDGLAKAGWHAYRAEGSSMEGTGWFRLVNDLSEWAEDSEEGRASDVSYDMFMRLAENAFLANGLGMKDAFGLVLALRDIKHKYLPERTSSALARLRELAEAPRDEVGHDEVEVDETRKDELRADELSSEQASQRTETAYEDACRLWEFLRKLTRETLWEGLHAMAETLKGKGKVWGRDLGGKGVDGEFVLRRGEAYDERLSLWKESLEESEKMLRFFEDCEGTSSSERRGSLTEKGESAYGLRDAFAVIKMVLGEKVAYEEEREEDLKLSGWLELIYAFTPHVVLVGLHEGVVPKTRFADSYLPETLKKEMGLRGQSYYTGRDAFMLSSLCACRRERSKDLLASPGGTGKDGQAGEGNDGRAEGNDVRIEGRNDGRTGHAWQSQERGLKIFLCDKTAEGEPTQASSLLMRVEDGALPDRVLFLFKENETEPKPEPLRDRSDWVVRVPKVENPWKEGGRAFSPSLLKAFLNCPRRFWMEKVLKMEEWDEGEVMSDRETGNIFHEVMKRVLSQEAYARDVGSHELQSEFVRVLNELFREKYGEIESLPLTLRAQYEFLCDRMGAGARVMAGRYEEGWEVLEMEYAVPDWELCPGFVLSMRIDCIMRHIPTGRLSVLDFKTSKKAKPPKEKHLVRIARKKKKLMMEKIYPDFPFYEVKGKSEGVVLYSRWTDLQLPLYAYWLKTASPWADEFVPKASEVGSKGAEVEVGGKDEEGNSPEIAYVNVPLDVTSAGVAAWSGFFEDDALMQSALDCAEFVMRKIREARFEDLPTAEELGWTKPYDSVLTPLLQDGWDKIVVENTEKLGQ